MSERYRELQDVILDPSFPELDLALRRGRHIDRDDLALYTLLTDAQDHLETLYRRYGCELVHKADGYFYLLPTGEKLSRRQLGAGDMLVGQALALMYLDPATIERGGRATTEDVVAQLVVVLGSDTLIRAFNPKRKRYDERVAQKTVRAKVAEGIRHLAALGFVDLDGEALRLRPALLRFAEPVRGLSAPAEALAKLVASGEVSLVEGDAADASEDKDDFDEHREGDEDDADEDDTDENRGTGAAGEDDADERRSADARRDADDDDEPRDTDVDDAGEDDADEGRADARAEGLDDDDDARRDADTDDADEDDADEGRADARAEGLDDDARRDADADDADEDGANERDADKHDADEPRDATKAAIEAETDLDDRDADNPDEQDDDW